MKEGARVQTNEDFAEFIIDHNTLPWRGVLLKRHPSIEGCWVVRFDHINVVQYINQAFLEKERQPQGTRMTTEEAASVIHEEAKAQGEPLTMDVCRQIAKRLFGPRLVNLRPGEIAQFHRERYNENL